MNKQSIQIIIIVIALGGAAWLLYNGVFKDDSAAQHANLAAQTSGISGPQDILPNGATLNFGVIDPSRFEYNIVQYPKLDPQNEVGIPMTDLFQTRPDIVSQ